MLSGLNGPLWLSLLQIIGTLFNCPRWTIFSESGIDIARQDFWQGGFDVIDKAVKELEDLPIE